MVTINLTPNNFSELPILLDVCGSSDNNQEYTAGGIFCRKPLHSVLNAKVSWFIMVTTYTPKKGFFKRLVHPPSGHYETQPAEIDRKQTFKESARAQFY